MHKTASRRVIVAQALVVTFLWSTSWVLIKWGLQEIPPLTFAGLRYAIAACVLLPGLWRRRSEVRSLTGSHWLQLLGLGLVFYTLTQGGQFLTLKHLNAIPFSLLLSFSPVFVAIVSTFALRERPTPLQWTGLAASLAGALLYFAPSNPFRGAALGFSLAGLTVAANVVSSLVGRSVNRRRIASPIVVTTLSMGFGALLMLGVGLGTQGLPALTVKSWGIVLWLAVVNTALAFTLWNHTLRVLSATESSVINNTMMIQIAILAWIFLGERLGAIEIVGLLTVAVGTLLVQWKRKKRARSQDDA